MSRGRRGSVPVFIGVGKPEPEGESRPTGGVLFADPSTAAMTAMVHPFDDPPSHNTVGGRVSHGIDSVTARESIYRKPKWYENKSSEESEDVDG